MLLHNLKKSIFLHIIFYMFFTEIFYSLFRFRKKVFSYAFLIQTKDFSLTFD